jgi:hypothetical protein
MDSLVVKYGVELAMYSKKTGKFARYDPETKRAKTDSIHPFLKVAPVDEASSRAQGEICLEEFRIYNEKDPSQKGAVAFGSQVYIVNK